MTNSWVISSATYKSHQPLSRRPNILKYLTVVHTLQEMSNPVTYWGVSRHISLFLEHNAGLLTFHAPASLDVWYTLSIPRNLDLDPSLIQMLFKFKVYSQLNLSSGQSTTVCLFATNSIIRKSPEILAEANPRPPDYFSRFHTGLLDYAAGTYVDGALRAKLETLVKVNWNDNPRHPSLCKSSTDLSRPGL